MRVGEVIETSTGGFWAESIALHQLPELGSLVEVRVPSGETVYGVVAYGQTAGVDSGRQAVLRGTAEVFDDGIYARHPELAMILRTTFRAVTVGYRDGNGRVRHYLAPCPPPLHYSVSRCAAADLLAFTARPRYFSLLLGAESEVPAEQVLAAHIRATYELLGEDQRWLAEASQQVARILKRDYDRLLTVLEAIDPGHEDGPTIPRGANGRDRGASARLHLLPDDESDLPF